MPRFTAYGTRTIDGDERQFQMPGIEGDDVGDARANFNDIVHENGHFEEFDLDRLEEELY